MWFTASPHPCVSTFKPIILPLSGKGNLSFSDLDFALKHSIIRRSLSKRIVDNYEFFIETIKPLRDKLESEFNRIMYENIENKTEDDLILNCKECLELEEEYEKKVIKMLNHFEFKDNRLKR